MSNVWAKSPDIHPTQVWLNLPWDSIGQKGLLLIGTRMYLFLQSPSPHFLLSSPPIKLKSLKASGLGTAFFEKDLPEKLD